MIFLIEYDRRGGRIVTFERFSDSARAEAEKIRLDLELLLSRQSLDHEVVLLQAASEEDLRRTHRRYFETPGELVERQE
ncbi:MAG: hypothetical protein ACHQ8D_05160 [Candidatus Rokuibacteriota bacterium]